MDLGQLPQAVDPRPAQIRCAADGCVDGQLGQMVRDRPDINGLESEPGGSEGDRRPPLHIEYGGQQLVELGGAQVRPRQPARRDHLLRGEFGAVVGQRDPVHTGYRDIHQMRRAPGTADGVDESPGRHHVTAAVGGGAVHDHIHSLDRFR